MGNKDLIADIGSEDINLVKCGIRRKITILHIISLNQCQMGCSKEKLLIEKALKDLNGGL
ncbi:MAG: hypothetical protein QW186_05820 [Candidatus Bathyarchaeia archaeon]